MKIRAILDGERDGRLGAGFAGGASAADNKEVQMLHWWTSGGEAAALNVIKQDLAKEGYTWKDVPVAGGGGEAAMTTLKAMVAAGNPPTASQILGYFAIDYAEAGKLADITSLATKEGWDKVVPTALQKFTTTDGKWGAVPVNIHSVNWVWINKAVMDKIGGTEPKNFDEFIALLDKAKTAGVIPLALGGQPWQEATMFDSVVASTGGIDFYKKAFVDLDASALKSDTMKKSFDNLAKLRDLRRPELRRARLEPRDRDGDQGRRARPGDGRLGQGRIQGRQQGSRQGLPLLPLPRHRRFGDLQHRHVRVLQGLRGPQGCAARARRGDDEHPSFQSAFNVVKGSVPARMDVPDTAFDMCGKKGIADVKAANAKGTFVGSMAQNYAQPPAIAGAYHDVVTKFFHGEIKTSDDAVAELVKAINAAK